MEDYRAGYRILVADDDINVHQSLNTYFRREGYQMISAYDGQEAIDHVRKSRPDIVLLDIMMPKMDGLMVCREIRKETNLSLIHIYMCIRDSHLAGSVPSCPGPVPVDVHSKGG